MRPEPENSLAESILFGLLGKLTLRPRGCLGLAWELLAETSDIEQAKVVVALGRGDTPLHALADMAGNIAADDPMGEASAALAEEEKPDATGDA